MYFPKKVEFESAHRAIEQAKAFEGGVAVLMDGKKYVMHQDYADQLIASGKELAYLCDHKGRIVTIPVND
jgi:hypothetical protein